MSLFPCVICFHLPIGPAHTSGGVPADSRTTAVTLPSREKDPPGPHASEIAAASSSPVHNVCTSPPFVLTLPNPELPSKLAEKRMRSGDVQASAEGDAWRFGVRFRAVLPPTGSTIGTT